MYDLSVDTQLLKGQHNLYFRLHGTDESFFLPYDLEVSHEELSYVCRKAENWRGEEGERRKTAVYDYIWEEEEVSTTSEKYY